MVGQFDLGKLNQLYIESGEWKCNKSPTGAHHWTERDVGSGIFICKYCFDVRKLPITLDAAMDASDAAMTGLHKMRRKRRPPNISLGRDETIPPTHGIQKVPMRRHVGKQKLR